MIHATHISRRYGNFTAVDDVSFTINSGEIVGLLGHNGAGKTTIMKMLTGFLEPSTGEIVIDGKSLEDNANSIQQLIGYLPENLPVYPEMTVMDHLFYCARMRNIPTAEIDTRVTDAIAKTQLEEKALQPIATLSRGYKQRVGVAQALIHNPKILILDEPTNGLDPHQTQQMRHLIRSLAKQATVIVSTHIMQEVDALCDRVLILDGGQLAVDQTMEELRRCEHIALETSASLETVNAFLAEFYVEEKSQASAPATALTTDNGVTGYQLPVTDKLDPRALCAWMTGKLVDAGEKVFDIHPILRDLETVFRNIHLQKQQPSAQEARNVA